MKNPLPTPKELCTNFVSYDAPALPRDILLGLANYAGNITADQSGRGALVETLEQRICEILGKPAAVFMPAGKTAQNNEGFVCFEVHTRTAGMKIPADKARTVLSLFADLVRSNGDRSPAHLSNSDQ